MKQSVYIETSVVSYLTGRPSRDIIVAGRQSLTREWWDTRRGRFAIYISALVVTEAEEGDRDAAQRRLTALTGISAVTISDDAKRLANRLTTSGPMPKEYPEDALHIAICALNGIDYLLTWNFTHLANASIRWQVERCLDEAGYQCPVICTPEELMEV